LARKVELTFRGQKGKASAAPDRAFGPQIWWKFLDMGRDAPQGAAQLWRMDKLQRAGREFLIRLVAKHGLVGAVRILRALAHELEAQGCRPAGTSRRGPPGAYHADC
jgi:hypothetical protein